MRFTSRLMCSGVPFLSGGLPFLSGRVGSSVVSVPTPFPRKSSGHIAKAISPPCFSGGSAGRTGLARTEPPTLPPIHHNPPPIHFTPLHNGLDSIHLRAINVTQVYTKPGPHHRTMLLRCPHYNIKDVPSLINIKDVLFSLNVSFCSFPLAFSCAYPKGKQVAFDISTRSKPSVLVYGKPYLSLFMSQGSAAPIAAEAEMDATPPCVTFFNGQPLHFFPWQSGAIKVSRQKSDGTLLSKAVWQR